jgi:putative flippase GtrA
MRRMTMTKSTLSQFLRFGISGGIGFVVDVAVLYLALAAGANFYWGRGISFLCAVLATWQINRNFAFKPSGSMSLWQEWWRYLLAMLGGGVINYLCSAARPAGAHDRRRHRLDRRHVGQLHQFEAVCLPLGRRSC